MKALIVKAVGLGATAVALVMSIGQYDVSATRAQPMNEPAVTQVVPPEGQPATRSKGHARAATAPELE